MALDNMSSVSATPNWRPHKSLPRRKDHSYGITKGTPVRPVTFVNGDGPRDSSLLPKSAFDYPVLSSGRDSGFPPTPPSNSREDQTSTSLHPQAHTNGASPTIISRASTTSTPLDQRSPPTPDITPPASLVTPSRKDTSPLSTSRTETSRTGSFRTAREEQWSSDEEDSMANSFLQSSTSQPAPAVQESLPDSGLGLADFETDDDESTPTQSRLGISKGLKDIVPDDVPNPLEYIPNREWDTNLMRNVTVRRKKLRPLQTVQTDVEPAEGSKDVLQRSPRTADVKAQHSPRTPTTASSPRESGWSPLRERMASQLRDSSGSTRLSTLSTSSTIVEAVVIATPPQRQRTLRHVSKKVILRTESSSSSESSPTLTSNIASLHWNDPPRPTIPQKQVSVVVSRPNRGAPSTPAIPLKHHRDHESLRLDAAKSDNPSSNAVSKAKVHPRPVDDSKLHTVTEIAPPTASVHPNGPSVPLRAEEVLSTAGPRVKFMERLNDSTMQKEQNRTSTASLTRSATQKALRETMPMTTVQKLVAAEPKSLLPTKTQPPVVIDDPMRPDGALTAHSVVKSQLRSGPLSPSKLPLAVLDGHRVRRSLDDSALEDTRRLSVDRSTIGTLEYARSDRSTSHTEEHGALRHLYSQVTPFSQISDVPESLELSEATAVNIYPHNNHSLLVVQQGARPTQGTPIVRRNTTGSAPSRNPPMVTIQPSTPPPQLTGSATINVDSPLKNPRPPPEPPAIKILPATPLDELETSPMDDAIPQRRPSLAQRARRYSDNLLLPIMGRAHSLRRTVNNSVRRATGSTARTGGDDGRLHPFWHPRGFWDDVSESDSEFGDDYYHEPWETAGDGEEGMMRLPPGGDTSDVSEPRRVIRGVLDGFRGTGGFLIGNSLGLERGPTNRRRHHVSVPPNMQKRNDTRVQKKDSQGSLSRVQAHKPIKRKVWTVRGLRVEYVGIRGWREMRRAKDAEKRREKLKNSIGSRWTVEGAPQV